MTNPDNVARLHEIKRLLDRIQQLPHIAGMPGNGLPNGFHARPHPAGTSANGLPNGFHTGPLPAEPWELDPSIEPSLPRFGPLALPLDLAGRESRALVPVQPPSGVGISLWVFVAATAVNTVIAAVLAVVITLGVARRDPAPAETEKVISRQLAE